MDRRVRKRTYGSEQGLISTAQPGSLGANSIIDKLRSCIAKPGHSSIAIRQSNLAMVLKNLGRLDDRLV